MDTFAFNSVNYGHIPPLRENHPALWLMVEGHLPPTLYVGAVLALRVQPHSVDPQSAVAAAYDGARVVVADIVGKRVIVRRPGAPQAAKHRFGAYVDGRAAFRLPPGTNVPAAATVAFVEPPARGGKIGGYFAVLPPSYDPSHVAGAP
uniref:Uncharacterized protein n=1 Tax=Marseillevirus LCMAC103 TaxID=2506604 RepID=A0A481YWM7_9VIRU|nr:MAG: hypothetical protein LCMAC103_03060 [Marseillevirus LCMAC103]